MGLLGLRVTAGVLVVVGALGLRLTGALVDCPVGRRGFLLGGVFLVVGLPVGFLGKVVLVTVGFHGCDGLVGLGGLGFVGTALAGVCLEGADLDGGTFFFNVLVLVVVALG